MKKDIDRMCDVLVHGQLFVDELEGFKNKKTLFSHDIKIWGKKLIREFRARVDELFKNTDDPNAVAQLYDINYALWNKLNSLTIDEKAVLLTGLDGVFEQMRSQMKGK